MLPSKSNGVVQDIPPTMADNLESLIGRAAGVLQEPETWMAYREEVLSKLATKWRWRWWWRWREGGANLIFGNKRRGRLASICRGYPG